MNRGYSAWKSVIKLSVICLCLMLAFSACQDNTSSRQHSVHEVPTPVSWLRSLLRGTPVSARPIALNTKRKQLDEILSSSHGSGVKSG